MDLARGQKFIVAVMMFVLMFIGAVVGWRAHQAVFEAQIAEVAIIKENLENSLDALQDEDGRIPSSKDVIPRMNREELKGSRLI